MVYGSEEMDRMFLHESHLLHKRKTAIITDLNGNLPALEEVVKELQKERIVDVVCIGDVVGYGAKQNETVELLRGLEKEIMRKGGRFTVVAGNGDFYVLSPAGRRMQMGFAAAPPVQQFSWANRTLLPQNREWLLSNLKFKGKEALLLALFMLSDPRKDLVKDAGTGKMHFKWNSKRLTDKEGDIMRRLGFVLDRKQAMENLMLALRSTNTVRFQAAMNLHGKKVLFSQKSPGAANSRKAGTEFSADEAFLEVEPDVNEIVTGHLHFPSELRTNKGKRLITVGSLGHARSGEPTPVAHYAVVHGRGVEGELQLEHRQAQYDYEKAASSIENLLHLDPMVAHEMAMALRNAESIDAEKLEEALKKRQDGNVVSFNAARKAIGILNLFKKKAPASKKQEKKAA